MVWKAYQQDVTAEALVCSEMFSFAAVDRVVTIEETQSPALISMLPHVIFVINQLITKSVYLASETMGPLNWLCSCHRTLAGLSRSQFTTIFIPSIAPVKSVPFLYQAL